MKNKLEDYRDSSQDHSFNCVSIAKNMKNFKNRKLAGKYESDAMVLGVIGGLGIISEEGVTSFVY